MRVLFDTNIFISYLLSADKENIIQSIIEAGFSGDYTLLLPAEVLDELGKKLTEKKYLAEHISTHLANEFVNALSTVARVISTITESIPEVSRDKKDDYLLAYAVVGKADYLVTGDNDLQVLKEVEGVKIVSPAEFLHKLKTEK